MVLTLHGTNRHSQRYGIQIEVRAGAILIDICTTTITTSHSHLYHDAANGFMRVALRLKWLSESVFNLAVWKSDEHTKTLS